MTRPDDETLMAYADGHLEASERARIKAYLATDPEARELVEMFRGTADLVAGVYDDIGDTQIPLHLIELIRTGRPPQTVETAPTTADAATTAPDKPARTADVIPFERRRRPITMMSTASLSALAACLAVVAGVAVAWQTGGFGGRSGEAEFAAGPVAAGTVLASVLESRPRYDAAALPAVGGEVRAVAAVSTFRDKAARACREFEVTAGVDQRPLTQGVACRNSGGGWTVEVVANTVAKGPPSVTTPAGGKGTTNIEEALRQLGATPTLPKDDEAALLARGWGP